MKLIQTGAERSSFQVVASTRAIQAAVMILQPGQTTGEPANEHPRSEQWLLVVSGRGRARVKNRRVPLRKNSLLLIPKNEVHQIANTGRRPLVTLSFYAPPAYSKAGEPLNRPSQLARSPR